MTTTETTTETPTVSFDLDRDHNEIVADLEAYNPPNAELMGAVTKALTIRANAEGEASKTIGWSADKAAQELWENSGDESVAVYRDVMKKIAKLQADADEVVAQGIEDYLAQAKANGPGDPDEARKNKRNAVKQLVMAVCLVFDTAMNPKGLPFKIGGVSTGSGSDSSDTELNNRIREWANKNGFDVKARGRIPAEVTEAYNKAH